MKKVIAIANQKGGVAKTTTAGAFAAGLTNRGYKVLAVDLDPQGNLSDSIGADSINRPTVYEMLKREVKAREVVQKFSAFDIIPANILLASADIEFTMTGKEHRLKETLAEIDYNYDFIILDTPPSLGVMTVNAFTYANEVIIPTTAGIFAATGIAQLYNSIETVKKYCNPNIKIAGILLTKYNPRANIYKDIRDLTETLGNKFNTKVYNTFIRNSIAIEEAQANKEDIYTYKLNSTVAQDYISFIDEYLEGDK